MVETLGGWEARVLKKGTKRGGPSGGNHSTSLHPHDFESHRNPFLDVLIDHRACQICTDSPGKAAEALQGDRETDRVDGATWVAATEQREEWGPGRAAGFPGGMILYFPQDW